MKVVLFCGGMGTRLGGLSDNAPKPMVKIGYRPILWHIMKYYAHFGHKEFILCLGYKADIIKDYFINYKEYISNDFTLKNGCKELKLKNGDLEDWTINFVDTGLRSNVGQRLRAVRSYVAEDDMFLANYSDGLTDVDLNHMIRFFRESNKIACFICVKPSQSFHVVKMDNESAIMAIDYVKDANVLINGGFFIFRKAILDYIKPDEELVEEPFARLIREKQLIGYPYGKFWCMDTFKEHQELSDMYNEGNAPWELWRSVQV